MKTSQDSEVLAHLRRGESLTQLDALRLYGVGRLAAVIFGLKQLGHDIRSEMVDVPKANGGTARVASYSLTTSAPAGLFGDVALANDDGH